MGRAIILALLLVGGWAGTGRAEEPPPRKWDWNICWAGFALYQPFTQGPPLTLDLHLADLGFATAGGRHELLVPFLPRLTMDLRRPSSRGNSISLSFAQAPLLFLLVANAPDTRRIEATEILVASLLWLSGGTYRWYPGGTGNLRRAPGKATSLGLVVKNQLDVHPFVSPSYVRESLSLGLAVRWDSRPHFTSDLWPDYLCSAGVFASAAQEVGGRGSFDPGLWVSCGIGHLPLD